MNNENFKLLDKTKKTANYIKNITINIPKSERIAIIITAGYYNDENEVLFSKRKNVEDIYKEI